MSAYLEQPKATESKGFHYSTGGRNMLDDSGLSVFVDCTIKCFSTITGSSPKVGAPFLCESVSSFLSDLSGVINVSGNNSGAVVFSAPKRMLSHMLRDQGLMSTQESMQIDLAGEVCNIISGNVRRRFGGDFLISPPKITSNQVDPFPSDRSKSIFVIPIEWHELEAKLIIKLHH